MQRPGPQAPLVGNVRLAWEWLLTAWETDFPTCGSPGRRLGASPSVLPLSVPWSLVACTRLGLLPAFPELLPRSLSWSPTCRGRWDAGMLSSPLVGDTRRQGFPAWAELDIAPGSKHCLSQCPRPALLSSPRSPPVRLLPSRPADPDWASYKLGIFICLNCSGVHRNFPDISKVKSVRLDFWDDSTVEVARGTRGEPGNSRAGVEAAGRALPFYREGN